ncbi:hypothetical protein SAMN05421854_10395 [Amycolatopsis rubida]|uniref:Uncharacterized protein n=1 Tax=Amycolatopsis rubida TaxID=112413 RepID=A0A1I5KAP2_9PSEU|nr:hypothetical protein SAMN05421854_10395 [Amycolatopsis rubida]
MIGKRRLWHRMRYGTAGSSRRRRVPARSSCAATRSPPSTDPASPDARREPILPRNPAASRAAQGNPVAPIGSSDGRGRRSFSRAGAPHRSPWPPPARSTTSSSWSRKTAPPTPISARWPRSARPAGQSRPTRRNPASRTTARPASAGSRRKAPARTSSSVRSPTCRSTPGSPRAAFSGGDSTPGALVQPNSAGKPTGERRAPSVTPHAVAADPRRAARADGGAATCRRRLARIFRQEQRWRGSR